VRRLGVEEIRGEIGCGQRNEGPSESRNQTKYPVLASCHCQFAMATIFAILQVGIWPLKLAHTFRTLQNDVFVSVGDVENDELNDLYDDVLNLEQASIVT